MTRINCGISVSDLSREHLLAEHREIKRVCYRLRERLKTGKFEDIPTPFYVIKGEAIAFKELFWLDKGAYTYKRYNEIYEECLRRKYKVKYYGGNWGIYEQKTEYWNDYEPTQDQIKMIEDRIVERLKPLSS